MAANEKITTSLEVDVTQFKKGLTDASRAIRLANSEFDAATAGMGKWSDSAEGLQAKLSQLDKTLNAQEDALSVLRAEYDRVAQTQGEGSKGAEELAIKINKQEAAIKKTQSAISKYNSDLDNLDDNNEEAADSGDEVEVSFSGIADGAKKAAAAAGTLAVNVAKVAGKTILNGLKAVATASAGIVTAFLATAETSKEWIGNMNKLEAAATDAGRSTEDAQKQFTDFYGILGDETAAVTTVNNLTAIGTSEENLASLTNSMSGIWAKYGDSIPLDGLAEAILHTGSLGSVQGNLADALEWSGISVDDFNTKLEACGTEAERQQLIVDTLNGVYGQLGQTYTEQNANIIEANKATAEMNNVMAEIGNSAMPVMSAFKLMGASVLSDLLPNIQQLGESFKGVTQGSAEAAEGIGTAVSGIIQQLVSKFTEAIPTIITVGTSIISSLVEGIINAAPSLASGVQQILQYFTSALPQFISTGSQIITSLLSGLASAIPGLISTASEIIGNIVSGLQTNLPAILAAGGEVIGNLLSGILSKIPDIAAGALEIVGSLVSGLQENLPKILEKGGEMIGKLGEGIKNNLPDLISNALDIIMNFAETLYDNFPTIIETGFDLLMNVVQGIMDALPDFIAKAPEIISKFANTINDNFPTILKKGVELIWEIIKGIIQAIPELVKNIPKIITAIVDVWEAFNWLNLGKKAITFLKDGILKMVGSLKTAGKNVLESITNVVKDLPGKLKSFGSDAIKNLGNTLKNGWSTVKSGAQTLFNGIVNFFKDLPGKLLTIGKDLVKGLWNGISDMTGWIVDKIQGFGESVLGGIKDFFGIGSPSKVMRREVGKWLPFGMAEGVEDNQKIAVKAMLNMAKSALGAANAELSGASLNVSAQSAQGGTGGKVGAATYVFNQYNSSPKALSRAEIYRQTKNQLRFASATT